MLSCRKRSQTRFFENISQGNAPLSMAHDPRKLLFDVIEARKKVIEPGESFVS
jgi:hypothetical protein